MTGPCGTRLRHHLRRSRPTPDRLLSAAAAALGHLALAALPFQATSCGRLRFAPVAGTGEVTDAAMQDAGGDAGAILEALLPLQPGDVRLLYGAIAAGGGVPLTTRRYESSNGSWDEPLSGPASDAAVLWVAGAASPTGSEELLLAQTVPGEVVLTRTAADTGWRLEWRDPAALAMAQRHVAVAYEQLSGDAMVVYATADGPQFRTRTGAGWSNAAKVYPLLSVLHRPVWMELHPLPGSDQLALAHMNSQNDLLVGLWDGTSWSPPATIATSLSGEGRPFDLAWENGTGRLLATWSIGDGSPRYAVRDPSGWSAAATMPQLFLGKVAHVDLAARPGGDDVAAIFIDGSDGIWRTGLALWNAAGSAFTDIGEEHTVSRPELIGERFRGAVTWTGSTALAVHVLDSSTGTLQWARHDGVDWAPQAPVTIPDAGELVSVTVLGMATTAVAAVTDVDGGLYLLHLDQGQLVLRERRSNAAIPAHELWAGPAN